MVAIIFSLTVHNIGISNNNNAVFGLILKNKDENVHKYLITGKKVKLLERERDQPTTKPVVYL